MLTISTVHNVNEQSLYALIAAEEQVTLGQTKSFLSNSYRAKPAKSNPVPFRNLKKTPLA